MGKQPKKIGKNFGLGSVLRGAIATPNGRSNNGKLNLEKIHPSLIPMQNHKDHIWSHQVHDPGLVKAALIRLNEKPELRDREDIKKLIDELLKKHQQEGA